jgi:hypothetical protein
MNEFLDEDLVKEPRPFVYKNSINFIWLTVFVVFYLFKTMHWPGSIFMFLGAAGFISYNLSCFISFKGKNLSNNISLILSAIWIAYLVVGCFVDQYLSFNVLGIQLVLMVVFFCLYEILKWRRKNSI